MAPTPIPDNYGIATVVYTLTATGEEMVTTFGFHNTGLNTADVAASDISDVWIASFTPATTLDSYTYTELKVLEKLGGSLLSGLFTSGAAGTVNAKPVPPAVAVRCTKNTALAGRKWRGRMFLPPAMIAEANVNNAGVIDSTTLDSIQTKCDDLLTGLADAGYPMYLLHHDLSTPTPVTTLQVRNHVGTQRRRQRRS